MKDRRPGAPPVTLLGLGLLLCVLGSGPLLADLFRLKDGRELEGSIVREIGDLVSIRTAAGIVTIDRSEIEEHERSRTSYDEYQERLRKLDDGDAAGHLALARFCESEGLEGEAASLYKRVVEIDSHNSVAREKLGYVWYAGGWYLDGSAELEAKRKEVESIDVGGAKDLDPAAVSRPPARKPSLPPLPSSSAAMAIKLDERIGRDPVENSGAAYVIGSLCRTLTKPIQAAPGFDPTKTPYVMEVKIRTAFLKQVQFYNLPLTNIYQCKVDVGIGERNPDGSLRRVGTLRFSQEFKLASRVDKERGMRSAYHAGIEELDRRLQKMTFFRKLGAKPLPEKAPR